jgi:hypothetical protein
MGRRPRADTRLRATSLAPLLSQEQLKRRTVDTNGSDFLRAHYTMTRRVLLRRMAHMRTVVIFATISFGALRVMWRAISPGDPLGSGPEWTADE